ncbi:MAG: cob(I)yrinic acid a,c-diamide adenosyltransferase [Calditrichaeota bacterium]|nr:MAG: cob(I)yrinic acid a,c-diamide adenosyltransferase [Calditrichota bacterium]
MVRITRVYTRTGDKGSTRLAGGQVISKASQRIEAYGTVDELNAHLGMVAESLREQPMLEELRTAILRIQNELFDLGSQLAVLPQDRRPDTPVIGADNIRRLETEIDRMNKELPPLTSFILPGGGEIGARLHVARTVCRRAERELVRLSQEETLDGDEIPYLNRLSDWLFVAARFAAARTGKEETLWEPGAR